MNIPTSVLKAFPQLSDAVFVRQFASIIPLVPDTTFDIFMTKAGHLLALVKTDYADPLAQSQELWEISGQHKLGFNHLLKLYDTAQTIEISEHDKMDSTFLVHAENAYFYAARLSDIK